MSADSRARFAQVVRAEPVDLGLACLLVGLEVDPTTDVPGGLAAVDALAALVPPAGAGGPDQIAVQRRVAISDGHRVAGDAHIVRGHHGCPGRIRTQHRECGSRRRRAAGQLGQPAHEHPPIESAMRELVVQSDDLLLHASLPWRRP